MRLCRNLLAAPDVWDKMAAAYEGSQGQLSGRILAALEAGQTAGGDARGKQSAAIIVYRMVDPENPWKNKIVDLRVDDNPNPIYEIGRLLNLHLAYGLADQGDAAFATKEFRPPFCSTTPRSIWLPEAMRLFSGAGR
jgi:uncharacterized Ntn-hydrolase superfamily protein